MRFHRHAAGFTIIELMLTLAVLGVLTMLAMPNFRQLLRNYEVRGAAESMVHGIQRARAEAVSRNRAVQFVLGSGSSWTVTDGTSTLDSRPSSDSANATYAALASDLTSAATKITFNNIALVVANTAIDPSDTSLSLGRITVSAPGASETLRVDIGAGGSARVCDPSLPSTNARAC
jgi:type IV fimbrial biogenesis protein FimT